ncbi:MAG: hypothetical protein EOM55_03425 [Clostridia bacterium]|nr:hypothetical protein [Clostridia bacterium]
MSDAEEKSTKNLLAGLGGLVAVLMIARYTCLIVQTYVPFLPDSGFIVEAINYIGLYAPMVLMILVGLSAVWDKSSILKLVFLIVCAAIVIFTFFPDVKTQIESAIGVAQIL